MVRAEVKDSRAARKTQRAGETMKSIQTNRGLKVKASVKAGGLSVINHNRGSLKVKTSGSCVRLRFYCGATSSTSRCWATQLKSRNGRRRWD